MKIVRLLFLIAIVIVSCQKESSTDPSSNPGNGNNNPPATDSTLLWKYIELDPTLPTGSDTTLKVTYTYDNNKRLISYNTNFYYQSEQTVDLFYSGNDTMPYKEASISTFNGDVYRDTVFYSYSNGLIEKDSTVEYNGLTNQFIETLAFVYTVDGNNTLFQYRHYSSGSSTPDDELNFTLFKTYENGNITVQEDTSSVVLFTSAHEQVSYDDKINPFYNTTPARYYPMLGPWLNAQKNNPLQDITWDTPSQQDRLDYTYSYRADGRPLSVTVNGPADEWRGIFLYTK